MTYLSLEEDSHDVHTYQTLVLLLFVGRLACSSVRLFVRSIVDGWMEALAGLLARYFDSCFVCLCVCWMIEEGDGWSIG